MKTKLALKAVLFTLLLPGSVTGLIPYLILNVNEEFKFPELTLVPVIELVFGIIVILILLYCIWGFAFYGKGTLAAVDPPKYLVVKGMYRYTRNPMYLAVFCILIIEGIFFASIYILIYAGSVFLVFHLYVVLYEEPHLTKVFGVEYKNYITTVPRWGIVFKVYTEQD